MYVGWGEGFFWNIMNAEQIKSCTRTGKDLHMEIKSRDAYAGEPRIYDRSLMSVSHMDLG